MDIGQVPISETDAFTVEFRAIINDFDDHNTFVYIDDVEFVESKCSVYPHSANPDYCHPMGPSNCSFQDNTFCAWDRDNGGTGWNLVHINSNTAIQLINVETGKLQSRTSCAIQTACLSFRYYFKVNYIVDLRVAVVENLVPPRLLWNESKSESQPEENKWDLAFIPLSTSDEYVVYFETLIIDEIVSDQEGLVYIDDIQFVPFPCDVYHTITTQFPAPAMMNTTQYPLSTLVLNKEESATAAISVTTLTALIITIALLVLTVVTFASIVLVVFCRRRRRKTRESMATRQAREQELELCPLHGGVGDDIIVHHGPGPHGLLESVYDEIPNSWSPDDDTNNHYDLPEASAEEGNQMPAASMAADKTRAPSLPNRATDHYDLPGTSVARGNQRSDYLTPSNDTSNYLTPTSETPVISATKRPLTKRNDNYLTPSNENSNYLTPTSETSVISSTKRPLTKRNDDYLTPTNENSNYLTPVSGATMTSSTDSPCSKDDYLTPSNENSNYLTPVNDTCTPKTSKLNSPCSKDEYLTPSNENSNYLTPVNDTCTLMTSKLDSPLTQRTDNNLTPSKYSLDYLAPVNSSPHTRRQDNLPTIHETTDESSDMEGQGVPCP
jgi:hypothetical protein